MTRHTSEELLAVIRKVTDSARYFSHRDQWVISDDAMRLMSDTLSREDKYK